LLLLLFLRREKRALRYPHSFLAIHTMREKRFECVYSTEIELSFAG